MALRAAIAAALLIGLLAPAGAAPAPPVAGSLALYTSIPQEIATNLAAGFMARYPQVRLEVLRAGAAEIERRLYAEMEVGGIRADLLWLADPPVYLALRDRGQLQPYRSPEARFVPETWKDPGGFFVAGRLTNAVVAVNTTLIPAGVAPRRWADLPRFGRTAAMPNPFFSGSALVVIATLVQQYGWGWFEHARREGFQVLRSNSEVARGLAAREFGVGVTLDSSAHPLIRDGAPLVLIWPDEGAISIPSPLAITRGARNVPAARTFVDYVLSQDGQRAVAAEGIIPIRPDVDPPPGLPRASEVRTLPVPHAWAAQNARELRARFEAVMLR